MQGFIVDLNPESPALEVLYISHVAGEKVSRYIVNVDGVKDL